MTEKIRFGAFYNRAAGTPIEFAKKIEDLGYDGFFMGESPNNRGPSTDTLTTLAYVVGHTKHLVVGPDVLLLPLHHPAWVARIAASIDVLSGGRLVLPIGVGGEFAKQFEAFGVPVNERGRRTNEAIEVMRALWTQEEASFHGRFWQFEGIKMEPKPIQKPHPPIWIGGRPGGQGKSQTAAVRRAARYGDGWDPYYITIETYADTVQQIKSLAAEFNRDLSNFEWAVTTFWLMRPTLDEAIDVAAKKMRYGRELSRERIMRYDILGSPKDTIERLEKFVEAGARYFICNWSCDPPEVSHHLEWIAKEVIPHFK